MRVPSKSDSAEVRSESGAIRLTSVEMERPSDVQGLIYLPFTDSIDETKVLLAMEMDKQGREVPADFLARLETAATALAIRATRNNPLQVAENWSLRMVGRTGLEPVTSAV